MKKYLWILVLCLTQTVLAKEPVGQVVDLVGDAWVTATGQKSAPANFKQSLFLGDTIETKANSAIKILFVDDTLVTLKENSKTLITEFLFKPEAKERKAVLNVPYGKIRTIVGKFFGEDQTVEIQTPTAVAGIRGTDLGALVETVKTVFYCFDGFYSVFNVDFPDQVIELTKGSGMDVLEGRPALEEHKMTIPPDVEKEFSDISLEQPTVTKEEGKESSSAKLTQEATKTAAKEAQESPTITSKPTTTTEADALDTVVKSTQESDVLTTTATTIDPSSSTQTNPGGTTENENKVLVSIKLP